jgi:protein ImuB
VKRGQRRRQAQACCSGLAVVAADPARDVRLFEQVVSAVAAFTPRVEVTRPGVCSFPARGPARYFGGEEALAAKVTAAAGEAVRAVAGEAAGAARVACRVGIADGPLPPGSRPAPG